MKKINLFFLLCFGYFQIIQAQSRIVVNDNAFIVSNVL